MTGVYSVTKPSQFLTRAEARFFGKESQPEEYQAGKPKADMMTKLIQPKNQRNDLDNQRRIDGNFRRSHGENPNANNALQSQSSSDSLADNENYEPWKHEFQAGVWFWRNISTGEITLSPPEHVARQEEAAPKSPHFISNDPQNHGTGSLVYDASMRATYLDFTKLVGDSTGRGSARLQ
eukprot:CAMPEP_0197318728 /NCGR_PEP_ID=MMETSP0891-20130614/52240_1 /TAXON_ID=44058 ORGANISM="Aureoumbra lagunensis, Strain CCMP1510" /NCGR_SAMPLE_ID=MMETSP0891 /ASSEMBLY_ACC=CAM_ASM_000534 /LENGTH=178 /DNA_ID=CAMNT_0042809331 /DNA_START=188 /DNA_END=724 /DNA_ORIENTATION=+